MSWHSLSDLATPYLYFFFPLKSNEENGYCKNLMLIFIFIFIFIFIKNNNLIYIHENI